MGDLKKRKNCDYTVKKDDEAETLLEYESETEKERDEEMLGRLRGYIQEFYELQLKKMEEKKKDEE